MSNAWENWHFTTDNPFKPKTTANQHIPNCIQCQLHLEKDAYKQRKHLRTHPEAKQIFHAYSNGQPKPWAYINYHTNALITHKQNLHKLKPYYKYQHKYTHTTHKQLTKNCKPHRNWNSIHTWKIPGTPYILATLADQLYPEAKPIILTEIRD